MNLRKKCIFLKKSAWAKLIFASNTLIRQHFTIVLQTKLKYFHVWYPCLYILHYPKYTVLMEIKTMFEVHGTLLFLWSSQRRIFKKLNPDHFSTVCLYVRPADPQCGKKKHWRTGKKYRKTHSTTERKRNWVNHLVITQEEKQLSGGLSL